MKRTLSLLFLAIALNVPNLSAQKRDYVVKQGLVLSYVESDVPAYTLPDMLTCEDGTKVTSIEQWETKRCPEILSLFAHEEFGVTPKESIDVSYETLSENPKALGGKATCRQVRLWFSNEYKRIPAVLLIYIPNGAKGKVPVIFGYNFNGNQSTTTDTTVFYSPSYRFATGKPAYPDIKDKLWPRGSQASRWSFDEIISRGYAVVTLCYHDIFPDDPSLKGESVASLFTGYKTLSEETPDYWQAIGAWAWGASRVADYLQTQPWADADRLAIMGHSRLGKTALWAGAQDTRFKVVISNASGCGGDALSRRRFGETLASITRAFPHWFCQNYAKYGENEEAMPFDQHELLALIAPRAVYVASAKEDLWADPLGEFLSAYNATPVYELYGLKGLGTDVQPPIHQPIMHDVGYHIRAGDHDVTPYDWTCYLDFCDLHLKK